MKGSIHSDQTCPLCGSRFRSMEPRGMFCPSHPKQSPTKFKVIFEKITRRFNDYQSALQFLTGLRFQEGSGQMDARDYQIKAKPLAFDFLVEEWLEVKKGNMRPGGWNSIKALMRHASNAWGAANVKSINYAQVEDLLNALPLAKKTKHNLLAALKQFWRWAAKRHKIKNLDDWPELGPIEMKYRKLVSLADQAAIIQNVKEHEAQWRVWLCLKWLATYSDCRPSELLSLRERDIDRGQGTITIWSENTKDRRTDIIPLTPEDWKFINALPVNFDQSAYFFRHDGGRGHTGAGQPFSRKMIWAAWKRACARLGIEGVDLYGGTRHSTVTGRYSAGLITAEEARKDLGDTSDAFHRYLTFDLEARRSIYARSQHAPQGNTSDNGMTTIKRDIRNS